MANKLEILEAIMLIKTARKQMKENPTYRLGQALYNLLPNDLLDEFMDESNYAVFYNSTDEVDTMEFFASTFVVVDSCETNVTSDQVNQIK